MTDKTGHGFFYEFLDSCGSLGKEFYDLDKKGLKTEAKNVLQDIYYSCEKSKKNISPTLWDLVDGIETFWNSEAFNSGYFEWN